MAEIPELTALQTAVESINAIEIRAFAPTSNSSAALSALETLNVKLEKAALLSRNCLEKHYGDAANLRAYGVVLPHLEIAGNIGMYQFAWLHISLNMLLPHCRYQTPQYLADTLKRLLDKQASEKPGLPFYKKAFLVIDEHCDLKSRVVFDQDNKGWKAIPNALKGRVFPDDDQFSLGLALVSTYDENPCCHIYVMEASEAADFFSLRAEGHV